MGVYCVYRAKNVGAISSILSIVSIDTIYKTEANLVSSRKMFLLSLRKIGAISIGSSKH
jgi:hypothetical protein